jgi:hypothetical protein
MNFRGKNVDRPVNIALRSSGDQLLEQWLEEQKQPDNQS